MNLNVAKTMANARNSLTEGAFQEAGSVLTEAKHIVREEAQKKTSVEIQNIIKKIQSNEPISTEEVALVKAWIVGDAEGYTKMEDDFQEWLSEYERLEKSLIVYENKECSSEDLLKLHGILEDATRVSYDIANFLENQDRIKRFESAVTGGLDKDARGVLVKVLIDKLQSPEF